MTNSITESVLAFNKNHKIYNSNTRQSLVEIIEARKTYKSIQIDSREVNFLARHSEPNFLAVDIAFG